MARSVNKVVLLGNVGSKPDIQQTQNGTGVVHLSLATNRRIPGGSEGRELRTVPERDLWGVGYGAAGKAAPRARGRS